VGLKAALYETSLVAREVADLGLVMGAQLLPQTDQLIDLVVAEGRVVADVDELLRQLLNAVVALQAIGSNTGRCYCTWKLVTS